MKKKLISVLTLCVSLCIAIFAFTACNSEVYNVTFTVDGVVSQTVEVEEGGLVTKPTDPTKNGYNFEGWYNGENKWSFTDNVINEDVNLIAKFAIVNYSISYDLNGGSLETANPTSYTIESETFTLNNPTKANYTFIGWSIGENEPQSTVTINKGSTGNVSYKANYAPDNFDITYNLNGGSLETVNPVEYTVDTETFTLNNPTKANYTFIGWTWAGQTTPVLNVTIEKGSVGNKEFTANYSANAFTISYVLNDGVVDTANPVGYTIDTESFTLNNPTKANYTFVGWTYEGQTEPQLTVTIEKGSVGNKEFTANFTADKFTLTYVLNDGVVATANPVEYTIETETFTLTNPTKANYNFIGWTWVGQTEPQLTVTIEKGSVGNKEFTANYSATEIALAYNLNNGTLTTANPNRISVETETFTLTNPTKANYTFVGWTWAGQTEPQLTVTIEKGSLTESREFTANYSADKFTLTYVLNDGVVDTANPVEYTIETETFTLNNPTKANYTFIGWTWVGQTEPQLTVTIEKGSVGNKEFTANFTADKFTLTYVLNDGVVDTANPVEYTVDTETFTLNNPTKENYTFIGWTCEGQTEPQLTVTIEKGSVGNKEFTANFTADKFTIAYVLNDGVVDTANPVEYTVETESFTLNNPTKQDYVFVGWTYEGQTEPQLTVTIEKGSAGNKEFTANFVSVFTVDENGVIIEINELALSLTSINIPAKINGVDVTDVTADVLAKITMVTEFTTSHPYLTVIDGNLYSVDGSILYRYAPNKEDKSFTLPESVTTIKDYAFASALNLTEVIIPDNVVTVGDNMFNKTTEIVVKVESSEVSANYPNNWADGAKDVVYDYLTGDDDDNIIEF